MVNAVEIVVGGVTGAAFGSIFDGITEVLRNAAEFTTSHTNINSTLRALKPLIQEIEGKNNTLLLQDAELKDLKEEIEAGLNRVEKLSEKRVWNYCMRPFYNMELDGMDKSLQRLLRILQVQGVRDVKEALVQVNKVSSQLDGCKTDVNKISSQLDDCKTEIVDGISTLGGKTTDQLDQVASNGKETLVQVKKVSSQLDGCKTDVNKISNQLDDCKTEIIQEISKRMLDRVVPISETVASLVEGEALGSSLLRMGESVDEALSKPNPHFKVLEGIKGTCTGLLEVVVLRRLKKDNVVHRNDWTMWTFDKLNTLRGKVEEGTKLIRKCSNVVVWTDHKMDKYASKLDDLAKFLEASVQRLKRTNSTMPKGFDTQNSRVHFCSPPFSCNVPWIKSSIDCC